MKNRKEVVLVLASAVCFLIPAMSVTAQSNTAAPTAQTQGKKQKTIKITLQNTTQRSMDLKSGDEPITLAAGQSRQIKVPAGTRIVTANSADASQPGTVVAEVTEDMSGTTVNLR